MFSHALSTHSTANEIDFFSAVDDRKGDSEDAGAGMIGTLEFNSATYYRYVAINLDLLFDAKHLGPISEQEKRKSLLRAVSHLGNTVWGVWFGRKTCLPAMPLSPSEGVDSSAAVRALLERLRQWEDTTRRTGIPPDLDPTHLERWEEPAGDQTAPGDFYLHDQAITFGQRKFHSRPVRHHSAEMRP